MNKTLSEQVDKLNHLALGVDTLCEKLIKEEDYTLSDGLFFLSEAMREIAHDINNYEKEIKN